MLTADSFTIVHFLLNRGISYFGVYINTVKSGLEKPI
jgi:hypothetical protein